MRDVVSNSRKFNSLDLALGYIFRYPTRYLFPIKAGAKFPPLVKDNLDGNASNDPEQIKAWVKQFTRNGVGPNWGVALKKSNLCPADVDTNPKKGKVGQKTYDDLDLMYGWPETETVRTPSGGFHKIYEGAHTFALGKYGLGTDIDIPNYLLIAGCTFEDGTSYVLENDNIPTAPKPEWFDEVIKVAKKERVVNAGEAVTDLDKPSQVAWAIDYLKNDAEPAIEGKGGENTTFRVACSLKDNGISQSKAFELMIDYYNIEFVCEPLWEPDDLAKKIGNAYAYSSLSKAGGKSAEAEFGGEDMEQIAASITPEVMGNPNIEAENKALANIDALRNATELPERKWTKPEIIESYVWIGDIERWMLKANPSKMLKKTAFDNMYRYLDKRGLSDKLLGDKKGVTIRRFDELVYRPLKNAIIQENDRDCYNTWRPSPIIAKPGDTTLWDDHLAYLFPDEVERNTLLNWLAGVLQHQDYKPKHALLLVGRETGTGKSFVAEVLGALLGRDNWQLLTQDILQSGFTGWALRTKLAVIEELRAVDRAELKNKLHPWVTQGTITINEKNLPTFSLDQSLAFLFMSNMRDAIQIDPTDRRYLVLETMAKPHAEGNAYYRKLYGLLKDPEALSAILHQLMTRDLKGYDIEGRAPETAAKIAMKAATANEIAQYMAENDGEPPFCYRTLTQNEVRAALPHAIQNRVSVQKLREALETQGFLPWPDQVRPDGRKGDKVRVWIKAKNLTGLDTEAVRLRYLADRTAADADDTAEDDFGYVGEDVPLVPDPVVAETARPDPWD